MGKRVSIVLPVKNEGEALEGLLAELKSRYPEHELIVVNDGSSDHSAEIANKYADLIIQHPYSMGNGAAIKNGARHASGEWIVFMDADGQHDPKDINGLLETMGLGFEMVIGTRQFSNHANIFRAIANRLFNWFATALTGARISDLTSGFRAINATKFRKYLYLLPNGFSYPTTITMAFLRSGYPLTFIPINSAKRQGPSKISPIKDGIRFLLIILKIGTLFSPLRIFLPVSMIIFMSGLGYYAYTFISFNRLTNMSVILFLSSLLIFMIGIVAEQISALHYQNSDKSVVLPGRTDRDEQSPPLTESVQSQSAEGSETVNK